MTDDPNARPSLSERYGVAVSNGTGLEHMILAAGMQHERLGAVLLRLQSEYDAVRGDLERAGQIAPQRTAQARDLMRRAALANRLKDYDAEAALKEEKKAKDDDTAQTWKDTLKRVKEFEESDAIALAGAPNAEQAAIALKIANGWDLEDEFNLDNALKLCDELPAAATAIMQTYRAAIVEGRLGN